MAISISAAPTSVSANTTQTIIVTAAGGTFVAQTFSVANSGANPVLVSATITDTTHATLIVQIDAVGTGSLTITDVSDSKTCTVTVTASPPCGAACAVVASHP